MTLALFLVETKTALEKSSGRKKEKEKEKKKKKKNAEKIEKPVNGDGTRLCFFSSRKSTLFPNLLFSKYSYRAVALL